MRAEGRRCGVIADKAGHLVTSDRVVNGSSLLEVALADGSRGEATLVGRSPGSDLAVIKVEAPPDRCRENCQPEWPPIYCHLQGSPPEDCCRSPRGRR